MTNGTSGVVATLDMIHVALERLGYHGEEFGASRTGAVSYGVYRQSGSSVVVSWSNGSAVYAISAATAAVAESLHEELLSVGLTAKTDGSRINVFGQEHIDGEVRKMFGL
jgi:hypothetical protein